MNTPEEQQPHQPSIDERLQAVTMSLELMEHRVIGLEVVSARLVTSVAGLTANVNKLTAHIDELTGNVNGLMIVVRFHEERLQKLENGDSK